MKERLQKLLAQANVASRRASEDLITRGRVRVNGVVAKIGDKADPKTDEIEVDGARLHFDEQKPLYIMLNKPKQVLSTDKPHRGDKRETVADLIGLSDQHLFSIGRLDADSEGLVVMTNDGDLAQRLSHPRYRHSKTYRVEILGLPTAETLERWQEGIFLEEGKTAPCFVEITKGSVKGTVLRIVMTEGKKRQIRRVAAALGHPVQRLQRTQIGMLALGDLAPGKWRELTPKEVVALSTPAPEIKTLRAQKRRPSAASDDAAPSSEATVKPRAARVRRTPAVERDSEPPRPVRAARPASADDGQQRRRRLHISGVVSSDESQDKRRLRRAPRPVSADDSPDKRSASKPVATDEAPDKRRAARAPKPPSSDDAPKKRRSPRVKSSNAHDDKWGRPSAPRSKKPRSRKGQPR